MTSLLSFALVLVAAAEVAVSQRPLVVHASPAQVDGASAGRWVAATLRAGQRATISTRMSATVLSVDAEEGARVRKGQLLISLSDGDLRAQLRAARIALQMASVHQKRIETLVAQHASPAVDLDGVRAQRAQAQAEVATASAQLAYAQLRAPFAGRVQAKRVSPGDLVGPGQPLLEIEGADLEALATLSESEASNLSVGQRLPFTAGGRSGLAEVIALAPGGDGQSHRQLVRARVPGAPAGLRSGDFARLQIPGGGREGLSVSRSALVERGDLTGVYVARDGHAELRWLALGELDGDRVPVRAGLRAGELVIDDPTALDDGAPVEVSRGP
jgi:membrane fusion protein (multidrug efflux system)